MSHRAGHRQRTPTDPPTSGTITSIEPQTRDSTRTNIHLNGEFAFGLHVDVVLNHHLAVGSVLDAETIAQLLAEDGVKKATLAALNLIAFRPRASGELLRKLREKGHSAEAAEAAVQRMQELSYLDDATFADRWVENRQEHRPRSRAMLMQELREKGIDVDVIAEVMAEAEIDEEEDAFALAHKKAGSMSGLDEEARQRRLSGFLARRGYGYDVIRKVLERLG